MRLSFRLIFSLIVAITVVTFVFAYYQVRGEKRALRGDLQKRAEVLADSLQETVEPLLEKGSRGNLQRIVERFGNKERLAGVAVYDPRGNPIVMTANLATRLKTRPAAVEEAMAHHNGVGAFFRLNETPMHVYALPLHGGEGVVGTLAVFHDASYIETESSEAWRSTLQRVLIQVLLIALITLLVVRWSITGPIARMAQWMRDLRAGRETLHRDLPAEDVFRPLTQEVTHLAQSLAAARAAAEEEARLRDAAESLWTAERLRVHVRSKLQQSPLFVVANREPCMHVHREGSTEVVVPASGLVTALQPILMACDGTWVAHGSGDADRENVDGHDRLRVPPEEPQYTLRRLWLSSEEEAGYYSGFANEGLWPLCHIAHTRPIFRAGDWAYYRQVNRKFADAVLEEMAHTERPILLVQDYHFALVPRLVKAQRPDVRVAIFWHIPWPNPQAFGICPWQRELLDGLLGADLVGFHIQSHCNYFLETVDGVLESRIDWEHFAVKRRGHLTVVKPFPISVASNGADAQPDRPSPYFKRAELFKELGVEGAFLGVGVDRLDYTKGIPERFRGIERFLERNPAYRGQFVFVQIGAPSRTSIERYQQFMGEVEAEADRINRKLQSGRWRPIVFLKRHHSHREIERFYKLADLCLVTSLHDGMNLVAKEFIAARDDDQGALVLSRFTGAARELRDALIVNPYDTEELAGAIRTALEMDPDERNARMRRLRTVVKEQNIYRWAANLITALSEIRLSKPEAAKAKGAARA